MGVKKRTNGHGLSPAAEKKRILKARHKKMAAKYKTLSPAQKKHWNEGQKKLKEIAKFFNESDKGVKPKAYKSKMISPKRFAKKIVKPKKLKKKLAKYYGSRPKTATAVFKKGAKKSLARKVVGKLGAPGKAIVGASLLYDYVKTKQKGKKGCPAGTRKVTKDGKTYCQGQRKGRDY